MTQKTVLVTRPDVPEVALNMLKEKCIVEIYDQEKPIPREDLLKMIVGKDALYCMLTDPIDKEVIEAAGDQLVAITTMSVGYDHIDLATCKEKGISVGHTPNSSSDSVAEWTVTLMLAAGRYLMEAGTCIAAGKWTYAWGPVWLCGDGLKNSVIGIVGMGRIGLGILRRVSAFGPKEVLYYDIIHPNKHAEEMGAHYASFEDLIQKSDFIACMCNLSKETAGIFCKGAFDQMKPNAVFVNTSRGGVVNQDDLYDALQKKKIRFAALDVTLPEPLPKDHKLLSLPNIIITPHVGSAEVHVRVDMATVAAENILLALDKQSMKGAVKF